MALRCSVKAPGFTGEGCASTTAVTNAPTNANLISEICVPSFLNAQACLLHSLKLAAVYNPDRQFGFRALWSRCFASGITDVGSTRPV